MKLHRITPWPLLALAILPASGTALVLLVLGAMYLAVGCAA